MEKIKVAGVLFFVFLILIGFVSGITGSIGNARMILRAETGDTIDKYILVKNVNNISLDVELSASGDLAEYIDILDDSFRLEPESEKKAEFVINVERPGTTQGTIDVKFTPIDGKNGVGLMSTIIVIAEKGSWWDWGDDEEDASREVIDNRSQVTGITGGVVGVSDSGNIFMVVIVGMILILLVLIVVFFVMLRIGGRR